MRALLGFDQDVVSGPSGNKCDPVVITPDTGSMPLTVHMSSTQTGGHIFYRVSNTNLAPQHNGDNAVSPTVRVGTNVATVSISGSANQPIKYLQAVCYQSGFLDSDISYGDYIYESQG